MRGLKRQENEKFNNFFAIVQEKARETHHVFFLFSSEGNEWESDTLECEDLSGWLVPDEQVEEFEKAWEKYRTAEEMDKWVEFFCWVFWNATVDDVSIRFEQFEVIGDQE